MSEGQKTLAADAARALRLLAIYLPQFHPIPENDEWWGMGFTEWTNVTRARPLFPGHYQPHLPADLGFYDLRLPEAREAQAKLAREYGIHGFCYYHYWFNGRRLLERPFQEVLASGRPDLPFCLCWANENWTRRWDGHNHHVLLGQRYGEDDDLDHIRYLAEAFADPRYVRVNGKPLFVIYRSMLLPDPRRTTDIWRSEALRLGIGELYLARMESFPEEHGDPTPYGFDAAIEFQPDWTDTGPPLGRGPRDRALARAGLRNPAYLDNLVWDYGQVARRMMERPLPPYLRFPGVTPSWDNAARRRVNAGILTGSSPGHYARWLEAALRRFHPPTPGENLVFINAWNEWAEGNHLEPDQRFGRGYLEATRNALLLSGRMEGLP